MLDTPYSTLGLADKIAAEDEMGVIRYGSPDTVTFAHKQITLEEAEALRVAGIAVGIVWEKLGNLAAMTTAGGEADADSMIALYKLLGIPGGKGIGCGFAVDFDPATEDDMVAIGNYFRAIHPRVIDAGYLVTGYLCGAGLARFGTAGEGLIHYRWLPGAYGWTGSRSALAKREYDILQLPQKANCAGLDVDLDTHLPDAAGCGLWMPEAA